jgi:uncharacterized membrane protein
VVIGAAVLWTSALTTVAFTRHTTYRTHRFDLGNMVQAVWSTAHGRFLDVTLGNGEQASRLASHADPILALLAPLWLLWPSPELLLLVQTVGLAAAALPIFWLGRKHSQSPKIGAAIALAYLLFPATLWNGVIDFHPVSLAVPLIAFAIWFLDDDRLVPFAVCAALAGTTEEQVPLLVGLVGIGYALRNRRYAFGFVVAATGVTWSALNVLVLIPHFGHGTSPALARYKSFGSSPGEIATTFLVHPLKVLEAATGATDLKYLALFAVPLLGLFVAAPAIAMGAVPQLVLNLTSSFWSTNQIAYQYSLPIVAFLFPASAVGLRALSPRHRTLASLGMLFLVTLSAIALGPGTGKDKYALAHSPGKDHLAALEAATAMIPPAARVSATNQIGGHLSARRYVYSFPVIRHADWVVVDVSDPWLAIRGERDDPKAFARYLNDIRTNVHWRLVCGSSGVLVFARQVGRHSAFNHVPERPCPSAGIAPRGTSSRMGYGAALPP